MTLPVSEQVIEAVIRTLEALKNLTSVPELYGVNVERNRDAQVTQFPTLVVVDGDWTPDEDSFHGTTRYDMQVGVEAYLSADNATLLGTALSVVHAEIVKAMLADVTLGGVAVNVTERAGQRDLDRTPGRPPQGAILTEFSVEFWTQHGDPYTLAG